jgi:predicted dienelactone hydrolase
MTKAKILRLTASIAILAFAPLLVPGSVMGASAAEQSLSIAGLSIVSWSPDTQPAGPSPLIVFSHGFHGCATQSRFLMQAWAVAGYIVMAPNHRDATCAGGTARWLDKPEAPFKDPGSWTESVYRDRADGPPPEKWSDLKYVF